MIYEWEARDLLNQMDEITEVKVSSESSLSFVVIAVLPHLDRFMYGILAWGVPFRNLGAGHLLCIISWHGSVNLDAGKYSSSSQ